MHNNKHLLLIPACLLLLLACSSKKFRKLRVANLGKFEIRDSVANANISDDSTQIAYLTDSTVLNDYQIVQFDSSTSPQALVKYSSIPKILSELLARGRFDHVAILADTAIPQPRPALSPVFRFVHNDNLEAAFILYSPKGTDGIYNDSTFNLDHQFAYAGIKHNSPRIFSLIYSKFFPNGPFNKKIYSYRPTAADSLHIKYSICQGSQPKWKYWLSPSLSFGTAIPIASNIVLTAGHCLRGRSLQDFYFVLGYTDTTAGKKSFDFDTVNVYRGIKILDSCSDYKHSKDYAFILLNKSISPGAVIPCQKSKNIKAGDSCYLVGYPLGIPQRVSLGSLLLADPESNVFLLNVDAFGGDSGSAIFNSKSDSLIGMLFYGVADFIDQRSTDCNFFRFCSVTDTCPGENVEKISYLLDNPKLLPYLRPQVNQP